MNDPTLSQLERLQAFRRLPAEERDKILEKASEILAPLYNEDLYNEDLAKPPLERELTAFTALDAVVLGVGLVIEHP